MRTLMKPLQREAITYLVGTIYSYGNSLSQRVAQAVNMYKGQCFTVSPSYVSEDRLYKFRTGGLQYTDEGEKVQATSPNPDAIVGKVIQSFLKASESYCTVAEDVLFQKSDLDSQKNSVSYLAFGEEIYTFHNNRSTADQVVFTLKETDATYYSFFALLSLSKEQQARFSAEKYDMNDDDLTLLSSSVQSIIQSAYDGESYLFWDRTGKVIEWVKTICDTEPRVPN